MQQVHNNIAYFLYDIKNYQLFIKKRNRYYINLVSIKIKYDMK